MMTEEGRTGTGKLGGENQALGWLGGIVLLVGLGLLVQHTLGWAALLSPWREIPPEALAVAVLLVLGSFAVRTARIHEYFHPFTSGRFWATFRLVLVHNLFNNLLPMRTGEASFPILMARQFRVSFVRSVPGLLYLRILDLHFVLFVGISVLAWQKGAALGTLTFLLAPIPFAIFLGQEWLRPRLSAGTGRFSSLSQEAFRGLPSTPGLFWRIWLWTGINWTVKLLVFAWVLRAFSPMPLSHALMGSTTGELSSVLPIHGLAGAGTYEAGVMASLVPLGVELDEALRGAVNLHLFLLGVSIMAGLVAFLCRTHGQEPGENPEKAGIFDK
jgi:uncharacterized membrane protein YbhN (UPF0104 family)